MHTPFDRPEDTIAFDNKRNFWKSRYSYVASCFANLNKSFFSSPRNFTNSPLYSFDSQMYTVGNTQFHSGVAVGSSIDLVFNNNPSSNKVYKSVSLEGSSNMGGANTFKVNNSPNPSQLKTTAVGLVQEMGGIVYGQIGKEITVGDGTLRILGVVRSSTPLSTLLENTDVTVFDLVGTVPAGYTARHIQIESSGLRPISSSSSVKYLLTSLNGNGDPGIPSSITTDTMFESVSDTIIGIGPNGPSWYANGLIVFDAPGGGGSFEEGDIVHEITQGDINGDDPKGQYAEGNFALMDMTDNSDWELYAVNVEYESTDYSHASRSGRKPSETTEG